MRICYVESRMRERAVEVTSRESPIRKTWIQSKTEVSLI